MVTLGGRVSINSTASAISLERRPSRVATFASMLVELRWPQSSLSTVPGATAPTRTRLVEKALAMELSGDVRILYEPSGVVCTIVAPLPQSA